MSVTVRYYAGARAAAGTTEEQVDAADVRSLVQTLGDRHGARLAQVLAASSLLVDGIASTNSGTGLVNARLVEVLPPFAGG